MVSPDEMRKAMQRVKRKEQFTSKMYNDRTAGYGRGIITPQKQYTMKLLRRISGKAWLINTIIGHIIDKTIPYLRPESARGKRYFAIELKDEEASMSEKMKKRARELQEFFLNTTWPNIELDQELSLTHEDDLIHYTKKILRDVLTLDQVASEKLWTRGGELLGFEAIDAGTILRCNEQGYDGDDKIRFVQSIDSQIVTQYTRNQILFQFQNPRTDVEHFGYGYCLPGWTKILTEYGYMKLSDVIKDKTVKIWDGDSFRDAIRIKSGNKTVKRTKFKDGTYIDTSKDHFFKIINKDGKIDWKPQKDIEPGEWVLSANTKDLKLSNKITLGEDMAEVLGWLYSDGTWSVRGNGFPYWRLFYKQKDKPAIDRHEAFLKNNFSNVKRKKTESELSKTGETLWITKSSEIKKYQKMGFDKDIITPIFNATNSDQKAFLRGVFSANGHVTTNYYPALTSVDGNFIRNISLLLDQIGIKSVIYKAKYDNKVFWKGKLRENKCPYILIVHDVQKFKDEIGFIHEYKTIKLNKWKESTQRLLSDTIPVEHARILLENTDRKQFREVYGTSAWHTLVKIQNRSEKRNKTFRWMNRYGIDADYRLKQVSAVESLEFETEMYDLSIIDGNSQFIADGIWVHNSKVEQSVDLVVSLINSFNFNAGAFTDDKLPRGMLLLNGDMGFEEVEQIEDYLIDVMGPGGVGGAIGKWGIPIIPSGKSGDKSSISWQPMGNSNQDMQYSRWQDTLYMSTGSVFGIDIESMGIKSEKGAKIMESGSAEGRKYSDDKGIGNALTFLERHFQHYLDIIDDRFRFVFHGFEQDDAKELREATKSDLESYKSVNDLLIEHDKKPSKFKFADVPGIGSPQVLQAYQAEIGQQQNDSNEEYDDFEKSIDDVIRVKI